MAYHVDLVFVHRDSQAVEEHYGWRFPTFQLQLVVYQLAGMGEEPAKH